MPTSTATTTSRASTGTTSPSTAPVSWACRRASTARSPGRSRRTTGSRRGGSPARTADILGPDNFYLELQDHKIPDQHRLNEKLLRLGPEMGLPLVATNDLHYVHREQREAHDALLCIGTGSMVEQTNRMRFETDDFYLKSAAQMAALFPDQPEAIRNTRRIAEMVDMQFDFDTLRLPDFPVPDGYTVESLAARGVPARPARAVRHGHGRDPGPARLRAGDHHQDGLRGLLPDRGRLRPVRPRAAHRDHLPRQRAGLDRDLHPGHHAGGPHPLPAAVRALPQPGPGHDAGYRRRLRGQPAGRGHRLRHPQVRLGPRGPDHHLRHDAGARRHPGCRARPGHGLRRGRPHRQGGAQPAGHQAGGGAPERAAQGDVRQRPHGPQAAGPRAAGGGRRAQRVHPRGGRGHQP